ncbi:MAG: hypothetical protein KDD48_04640 [Bdellovibrionales bacterium]|nr:hypothetical protein [Bdellovibrionales bacterium]
MMFRKKMSNIVVGFLSAMVFQTSLIYAQEAMVLIDDSRKSIDAYADDCVQKLIRSQLSKLDGEYLPYLGSYTNWKNQGDDLGRNRLVFFRHRTNEQQKYVFSPDGIMVTDKSTKTGYTILEMTNEDFSNLTTNSLLIPTALKTRSQTNEKFILLKGPDQEGDVVSWQVDERGNREDYDRDPFNFIVVRDRFTYKVSIKDTEADAWIIFYLMAMVRLYGVEIEHNQQKAIYCEFDTRDSESDFRMHINKLIGGSSSAWDENSGLKWFKSYLIRPIKYINMNNEDVPKHSEYVAQKFFEAISQSSGTGSSANFAVYNYGIDAFASTNAFRPGSDHKTYKDPNGRRINNLETRIRYQVESVFNLGTDLKMWIHDLSRMSKNPLKRSMFKD